MTNLYDVVANLVRLARRLFKMGDEARSEKAREGIRSITGTVGISSLQTQFPVAELLTTDLVSKIPQMNESGPFRHVLRYGVDFASLEEEGTEEIWLELWRLCRKSHHMIAVVGQLYSIEVKWGSQTICVNVLAMVDGVMQQAPMPAVLECGVNNARAYTTSRFDWEIFMAFSNREDCTISAAQRLLFMLVLDATAFDHCDVDAFVCWPASMVWDEMDRHQAGQYYNRFSAERAGLVELDENWEDSEGSLNSTNRDEEGSPELKKEAKQDTGKSPILQFMTSMEMVKEFNEENVDDVVEERVSTNRFGALKSLSPEEEDKLEAESLSANRFAAFKKLSPPEILRGPVAKSSKPRKKKEKRGALSIQRREKCQLTTAQFKAILSMCIEGVNPWRSEEDIEKEIEKVDVEKLTERMNEQMKGMDDDEDVGELLRKVVQEDGVKEEADAEEEMTPWSPGDAQPESDVERPPELEEFPEELFSEVDEDGDETDLDDLDNVLASTTSDEELEELPELINSFETKPSDWDTTWHSESSGKRSSKGYSPGLDKLEFTPSPAKKVKEDGDRDRSSPGQSESPLDSEEDRAILAPFLSKVNDDVIVNVTSESSGEKPKRAASVKRKIVFPNGVRQGSTVYQPMPPMHLVEATPRSAYYADDLVVWQTREGGVNTGEVVEKEKASGDTSEDQGSNQTKE